MKTVGRDLHTRYQQVAMLDEETGELVECRRVAHLISAAPSQPRLPHRPILRRLPHPSRFSKGGQHQSLSNHGPPAKKPNKTARERVLRKPDTSRSEQAPHTGAIFPPQKIFPF